MQNLASSSLLSSGSNKKKRMLSTGAVGYECNLANLLVLLLGRNTN